MYVVIKFKKGCGGFAPTAQLLINFHIPLIKNPENASEKGLIKFKLFVLYRILKSGTAILYC